MRFPHVAVRVKQHDNYSRLRVNASQIRALMEITVITRQGQVAEFIRAVMLLRDKVVNMEERKGLLGLRHPAILTAVTCPLTHQAACCHIDHAGVWLNKRRALALRTLITDGVSL